MRQVLAEEFTTIHIYNLRGNQRTAGEQSRQEGGKVFDAGCRATVAITVLVKNPTTQRRRRPRAAIHYTDIGDYLTREEKLAGSPKPSSIAGLSPVLVSRTSTATGSASAAATSRASRR